MHMTENNALRDQYQVMSSYLPVHPTIVHLALEIVVGLWKKNPLASIRSGTNPYAQDSLLGVIVLLLPTRVLGQKTCSRSAGSFYLGNWAGGWGWLCRVCMYVGAWRMLFGGYDDGRNDTGRGGLR
jgi:hypothetical protein